MARSTVRDLASLVRLSHTIFAMPFALASAALAHRFMLEHGGEGVTLRKVLLIVVAFTGARTAAMAFNRIVDRDIDAANPRTASREIPRGAVSLRAAWTLTILASAAFLAAAIALGPWPARLALPALAVVLLYSLVKRVSWAAHLVLGLALALSPGGAWVAVTGGFAGWPLPLALMIAVATWVAGFDVLYSLQDREFDATHGLHSIPVRFGVRGALVLSGLLHIGTVAVLFALHRIGDLGLFHLAGVTAITGILAYEHAIVRPSDLSRIDRAFFDLNGYVSLVYLLCTVLDTWLA
ncbi:MAG: 4-hydroxybenzoate octaprenyltransferase [Deltaproteobacteria bacterium]|nr:MAG: 4-hydroxybenzoate octaprenyltransferase [Deltaproteobacteria bacterium]